MSKKKKDKSCKKYARYNDMLFKVKETNKPTSEPIIDLDNTLDYTYKHTVERIYGTNPAKTGIVRAYRNKYLLSYALSDENICSSMGFNINGEDYLIYRYMESLINMLYSCVFEMIVPVRTSIFDHYDETVKISMELNPNKLGWYFRLTKDSPELPGCSRLFSNYLIDNASAIIRMNKSKMSKNFSDYKIIAGYSSMNKYTLSNSIDRESLENDPKMKEELDIRHCMLGDIEYMTWSRDCPIYCFIGNNDNISALYYPSKGGIRENSISVNFGMPCDVITNPDVLIEKYTKSI